MKPRHFLKELEQVAAALALTVRTQPFRTAIAPGGLCKLRGQAVVLLNSRTHEDDRALVLAEVLNAMDVARVPMSEDAREFLATRQGKRLPVTRPGNDTRRGPGLRRTKPRFGGGY